ncbi:MAG: TonB family protein [Rhizobiaceae bacterium]|nr:TonB family protein [Rhizobiaceae bacterium]
MAVEPAFIRSTVWPVPGAMPLEPDDPRLAFPANVPPLFADENEAEHIADRDAVLSAGTLVPLALKSTNPSRRRMWRVAIIASLALHSAVAAFFLVRGDDGVQVAGAEDAGIVFLGNASEDRLSSGSTADDAAVDVTLIEMIEARDVPTAEARSVTAEPVAPDAPSPGADAADSERVEAVAEDAAVAIEAPASVDVPTEGKVAAAPSDIVPEILAADTVAAPADDAVVPEQAEAAATDIAQPEPEDSVAPAVKPDVVPVPEVRPEPIVAVAEEPAPVPEPKVDAKPAKTADAKPTPAKAKPKKAAPAPAKKKASAGSGGKNAADARKGDADGRADGVNAAKKAGKGTESAAGNAEVTNYPGKVRSKLQRSVKRAKSGKKGSVTVAFTVSASGSVSAVRVASSSGSPDIDKAGMDAVRRAAPFPPIPKAAGKKSWAFTVPLSFR